MNSKFSKTEVLRSWEEKIHFASKGRPQSVSRAFKNADILELKKMCIVRAAKGPFKKFTFLF